MTWPLFSETSKDMPADLVLFNQTCLLVHWKSKRKATAPPSDMPTYTVKLYQPRPLHCQYKILAV